MSLKLHLCVGLAIRIALIVYGEIMDDLSAVPYTDVDYKVFTDAARHVLHSESPYKRHTYRYTPLIAYLLLPNVSLHRTFGKFLFSFFDMIVAAIISSIVKKSASASTKSASETALLSAQLWLYNPLAIVIATRGNADSIASLFILLSLKFMQGDSNNIRNYALSGFFLAIAIHLRLYPIVYSFPMYISLGKYHFNRHTTFMSYLKQLIPNVSQIVLAAVCVATLVTITAFFYHIYGYEFLFESYIYHLLRNDIRHNFSVYFYLFYLGSEYTLTWIKVITLTIKVMILLIVSINYGSNITHLNFCLLLQTILIVSYNSVITSQYFIWFHALLPLVVKDLNINLRKSLILFVVWAVAQASWLFQAYLLEFKSRNTFLFIWIQGIAFFAVNMFLVSTFIKSYSHNCRIARQKIE